MQRRRKQYWPSHETLNSTLDLERVPNAAGQSLEAKGPLPRFADPPQRGGTSVSHLPFYCSGRSRNGSLPVGEGPRSGGEVPWLQAITLDRVTKLFPFLFAVFLLSTPAQAVQPNEILQDPALESRARDISSGLRCLVCQNQSIDDSDAPVAQDLRMLIREQLTDGKSDAEVVDFVVARYGEYVLLQPRLRGGTMLLWFAPFAILLAALLFAFRRRPSQKLEALSAAERADLERLVGK